MKKIVLFIDDDPIERRSHSDVLKEIFDGTEIEIDERAPLKALADYNDLIATRSPAAFILDQRLNTTQSIGYLGSDLAAHVRAIGGRIPIFILTNYPDDDFVNSGWAVECIVKKKEVLRDPTSPAALEFKARLARQIDISGTILAAREQRFHELLVKSSRSSLSPEEEMELKQIEDARITAITAAERSQELALNSEIENLKRILGSDRLF